MLFHIEKNRNEYKKGSNPPHFRVSLFFLALSQQLPQPAHLFTNTLITRHINRLNYFSRESSVSLLQPYHTRPHSIRRLNSKKGGYGRLEVVSERGFWSGGDAILHCYINRTNCWKGLDWWEQKRFLPLLYLDQVISWLRFYCSLIQSSSLHFVFFISSSSVLSLINLLISFIIWN